MEEMQTPEAPDNSEKQENAETQPSADAQDTTAPKSKSSRRRRRRSGKKPKREGVGPTEKRAKEPEKEKDRTKKILINAVYPEEKRVAIVEGDTLVDFYVEVASKEHLKGNIYKGIVAGTLPGLQAMFVNFGPKKHGFLQMREIMPDLYKDKEKEAGHRMKIQDIFSKGDEIIVQVEKDERDTKGASLTTYISIPGRYIVMMPGQDKVGISRKIENQEDRDRLKDTFNALKLPKKTGFILRTACGDTTEDELSQDLKYLTKLWTRIQADAKKAQAPALIYKEHDIAVRTVRDYLTSDVTEVLIDDLETCNNTKGFLKKTLPWCKIIVKHYKEKKPIFSNHNIEGQISRLNERFVNLPSKGYLVFDKTEALTSIDVNSGRSRKEENVESTAMKTDIEAAAEIGRQLRLRDIGGLIVIDFIDLASSKNRKELEKKMKDSLVTDKANTELGSISKFGLMEMTRERLRTAYFDAVNVQCVQCSGRGIIKSNEFTALSAMREMHHTASGGGITRLNCRLPVDSANYLMNAKRNDISGLEKTYDIKITVTADPTMPAGQYSLETGNED